MVAIFTGNGLGVFGASFTQPGQGGGSRLGQSRETYGINAATGNLVLQGYDESLATSGLGAVALRTYNSRGQVSGAGQDGWSTGYERWVELASGELNAVGSIARLHMGDGETMDFVFDATRGYFSTRGDGAHDRLVWEDEYWALQDADTLRWETYSSDDADPSSRALLRSFHDEGARYAVNYDALGRVSEVVSLLGHPNGDAIVYSYVGSTQQLASIGTRENGVLRTQVSYGYDGVGRLSWVQTDLTPDDAGDNGWSAVAADNNGRLFRTSYTYVNGDASDLRIASATTSDGTTVSWTYEGDGAGGWRVKTVTEGTSADGSARTLTFIYGAGSTDVVDAAGRVWTYRYDAAKQLIETLAPAVDGMRTMTSYAYDADGNVIRIATAGLSSASGISGAPATELRFRYDARGNRTQQRDLMGNVVAWTYNVSNRITSETRYTVPDVDGWDADDPSNGSSPSGAMTTRYIYLNEGSNRLRFVVNAAGEVRELTYVDRGSNLWLLAGERSYLGDRYTGTAYTVQALSAWATDATAQRLANSNFTSHDYDAHGRLAQTVAYAKVDASGVAVMDGAATVTRYIHDAQGLLRQSIVSRGGSDRISTPYAGSEVTEYAYDGMGRLLGVLKRDVATAADDDARTLRTTYSYLDASNRIQVTEDTGLVRIEARNRAGDLLSVSESGMVSGASTTRSTRNYYDDTGRLRASEDAAGGRSYFFYDDAGRLVATVDATGAVGRSEYDVAGHVVQTTRHAIALNTQGWLANDEVGVRELVFAATQPAGLADDQVWVARTGEDRVAQLRYDAAGRMVQARDNVGSETSYTYDGAGRLVSTTAWGDWIYAGGGWGDAPSMKMARPPTMTRDARTMRMFYDSANRLVATLDAAGYLSESVYDAGGRLVKSIRYASLTNGAYRANGTLEQLRPVSAVADQVTRLFYDARGREIGRLDAEGHLSESIYDEQNNQRASRAYARQLTGLSGQESFVTLRTAALAGAPAEPYRETQSSYNGLGQLVTTRDHEGAVTRYHYDDAGRLVKTESAAGTSDVRANGQRFDVFGNLIGELNGDAAALLQANMGETQLNALYAQSGVRHRYDVMGRRIETEDQLGHKTWFFYDAAGRQRYVVRGVEDAAELKNALGEVSEIRYTTFGDVAETLAYEGRITLATPGDRASAANALSQLAALEGRSNHTRFGYDLAGRLSLQEDSAGLLTFFGYNRYGDLTGTSRQTTDGGWFSDQEYGYDRRGLRTSSRTYAADAQERETHVVYDAFGRVTQAVDARGTVSTFAYDRLGRQIGTTTHGVGGQDLTTQVAYDAFDRIVARTDAMGRTTQYAYNDSARSTTVTSPEGVAVTMTHDAFGQQIETRQALPDGSIAIQRWTYDNRGLLVRITDALGHDTVQTYDVRGQLLRTTDATGRSVAYAYDAGGRTLRRIEDPDGLQLTTRYVYDGQGRQLEVIDAAGRVTRMQYDRTGHLIELARDPDGLNLRTQYAWDAAGRQLSVTEAAGTGTARTTAYVYDGHGRRVAEIVDPEALALRTDYAFDANDNLIARTTARGTQQYAYDVLGRLRYSVDESGGVSERRYDTAGQMTSTRVYVRPLAGGTYGSILSEDELTALIAGQSLGNDEQDLVSIYFHDDDGRLVRQVGGDGEVVEYGYDSAGREISRRIGDSQAASGQRIDRSFFDGNGREIYRLGAEGSVVRIDYDAAGRVVQTRTFVKAYADASLATTTRDSLDAFTSANPEAIVESTVYDSAGRQWLKVSADGAVVETRYDGAGVPIATLRYTSRLGAAQLSAIKPKLQAGTAVKVDFDALLTTTAAAAAAAEFAVHDGAGRIRYQVRRTGETTLALSEWRYDSAGRLSAVLAYPASVSRTVALDAALLSGTASESDFNGFAGLNVDRANVSRFVYDSAGRKRFEVNAKGEVKETRYGATGLPCVTLTYTTGLNPTTDAALMAGLQAGTASDTDFAGFSGANQSRAIVESLIHDATGRVRLSVRKIDASRVSLVEYQYDAAGVAFLSRTHARYANIDAQLSDRLSQGTASIGDFTGDLDQGAGTAQSTIVVHDASGRMRFTVNGEGEVVEYRYSASGETIGTIRYAARLGVAERGQLLSKLQSGTAGIGDFSGFVAANQAVATSTFSVRDAEGRVRFELKRVEGGLFSVVERSYDGIGDVVADTAFTALLSVDATLNARIESGTANAADFAAFANANRGTAQVEHAVYDVGGRIRFSVSVDGTVRETRYDALGAAVAKLQYIARLEGAHAALLVLVKSGAAKEGDFLSFVSGNAPGAELEAAVYDLAGNERLSIRRVGAGKVSISEHTYDATGRRVASSVLTKYMDGIGAALDARLNSGEATMADFAAFLAANRATAQNTWSAYDAAGRLVYTVNGVGAVTKASYDAAGQVVGSTEYATTIATPAAGVAMTEAQIAATVLASGADRQDYNIHDGAGRMVFHVHASGVTQQIRYDGAGRVTAMLAYAATIAPNSPLMAAVRAGTATEADFASFVATNESAARLESKFHDAAGRVLYKLVRSGSGVSQVVGNVFDALGNLVEEIHYGVEIQSDGIVTSGDVGIAIDGALSSDPMIRSTQVRSLRHYYDLAARQRFTVDSTGAVVEERFDGAGQAVRTTDYGVRPPTAALTDYASLKAWAAGQLSSDYRSSTTEYDEAGRVVSRTDAIGNKQRYEYDAAGNKIRYINRDNAVWSYTYDLAGRLIDEISPAILVSDHSNASVLRSVVTRHEYDGAGNLVAKVEDAGGATSRTTRYRHDGRGLLTRTALPSMYLMGDASIDDGLNAVDVAYDSFGQAVVEKDANGNFRYKVYDQLGRTVFEIDQMLQVTEYRYDTFGNEVRATRFENTLNPSSAGLVAAGWHEGAALTEGLVRASLVQSARDRSVESGYTILGQKCAVMHDAVTYYRPGGAAAVGRPTLLTTYNTYGEVVKSSILLEGTPGQSDVVWAETHHYYDRMGREVMNVDAEGYVNTNEFNAYGDVVRKTEHARRLWPNGVVPQPLSIDVPPAVPPSGDAQTGFDRIQLFEYDALGRVNRQVVRRHVQVSSVAAMQQVDVATVSRYDNEGHEIESTTDLGTTYTKYDALGRAISVRSPQRRVAVDRAANGTPLSIWSNDAAYMAENHLLLDKSKNLDSDELYEIRSQYNEFSYNAHGNLVRSVAHSEGMAAGQTPSFDYFTDQVADFDYNCRGWMVWDNKTGTEYKYDNAGHLIGTVTTMPKLPGGGIQIPGAIDYSWFVNEKEDVVLDKTGRKLRSEKFRGVMTSAFGGQTFELESAENYRYNAFGEVVARDDRVVSAFSNDNYATYVYDNTGMLTSSNAEGGIWRSYGYDLGGRGVRASFKSFTMSVTATGQEQQGAIDVVVDAEFDRLGRLVRQRMPTNSDDPAQRPELVREYDRWGNVIRAFDARGYETRFEYNDQNKVTREIRPQVRVVDNHGLATFESPILRTFYNAHGAVTQELDANGHSRHYVHDAAGQLLKTIDAMGNATTHAYDAMGNEILTQEANGAIKFSYHNRDGLVVYQGDYAKDVAINGVVKRSRTTLSKYFYNADGSRTATIDALGNMSQSGYDSRGLMTSSTSAMGVKRFFAYDRQGRKTLDGNQVDSNRWAYDYFGRVVDHDDYGNRDYDYVYHADTGQLIKTIVKTTGNTQEQFAAVASPAGATTQPAANEEQRFYYASGLLKEVRRRDSWTRYEYDKAGNRVSEETCAKDPGGNFVRVKTLTTYDSNGRVSSVKQLNGNATGSSYWTNTYVHYNYDAMGNRREVAMGRPLESGAWESRSFQECYLNRPIHDYGNGIKSFFERAIHGFKLADPGYQISIASLDGAALPSWLHFDPATLSLTGTPDQVRDFTVRIRVVDRNNQQAEYFDLRLNVLPSRPPATTYAFAPSRTVQLEHGDWSWDMSTGFQDPDGGALRYSLVNAPAGVSIDPLTGVITGTPSVAGDFAFKVRVEDADHVAIEQQLWLTVTPWEWKPIAYVPWHESATVSTFQCYLYGVFPSINGAQPSHYLLSSANSSPLPSGLSLMVDADGEFMIVATTTTQSYSAQVQVQAVYAGSPGTTLTKRLNFELKVERTEGDFSDFAINRVVSPGNTDATAVVREQAISSDTTSSTEAASHEVQTYLLPVYDNGDGSDGGSGGSGGYYAPIVGPGPTFIRTDVNASSGPPFKSLWFDYDANNRVVIGNAKLENGEIKLGAISAWDPDISYEQSYDAMGNVTQRRHLGQDKVTRFSTEFTYNLRGQKLSKTNDHALNGQSWVAEDYAYNDAMQLAVQREYYAPSQDAQHRVHRQKIFTYDKDGRQTLVKNQLGGTFYRIGVPNVGYIGYLNEQGEGGTMGAGQWRFVDGVPEKHNLPSEVYGFVHTSDQVTTYDDQRDGRMSNLFAQTYVTDAGALTGIGPYTSRYEYIYEKRDSYLERGVAATSSNSNFVSKTTDSDYDVWNRRLTATDGSTVRKFMYSEDGQILRRREGNTNYSYSYVNGQMVSAKDDTNGWIDIVGQLTGYSNSEGGSSTTIVQQGETLRAISQRVYGDEGFWYVLAMENGIADDGAALQAGMTLKAPHVEVHKNTSATFKPYNPGEIIGSNLPALDYVPPPPPEPSACQKVMRIVAIVVAVVITAVVSYVTGGIGGAMLGAALGSITSQTILMASDLQATFDWGSLFTDVAIAAVTAGIASGIGNAVGKAADAGSKLAKTLVTIGKNAWAMGAAQSVLGNVVSYGVNWVANRLDSSRSRDSERFNWAGLAASAVGGALAGGLGGWASGRTKLNGVKVTDAGPHGMAKWFGETAVLKNEYVQQLVRSTVVGFAGKVASHHVARALGEQGEADYGEMFRSALWNGVGDTAAEWTRNRKVFKGMVDARVSRQEARKRSQELERLRNEAGKNDPSYDPLKYMYASSGNGFVGNADPVLGQWLAQQYQQGRTDPPVERHYQLQEVFVTNRRSWIDSLNRKYGGYINTLREYGSSAWNNFKGYVNDAKDVALGHFSYTLAVNTERYRLFAENFGFDTGTKKFEGMLFAYAKPLIQSKGHNPWFKDVLRTHASVHLGVNNFIGETVDGLARLGTHIGMSQSTAAYYVATRVVGVDKKYMPASGMYEKEIKNYADLAKFGESVALDYAKSGYAFMPNGVQSYVGMKVVDGIGGWASEYASNAEIAATSHDPMRRYEYGGKVTTSTLDAVSTVVDGYGAIKYASSAGRISRGVAHLETSVADDLVRAEAKMADDVISIEPYSDPAKIESLPLKPQGGAWGNAPSVKKWVGDGGGVISHSDGSMTFIRKDGISVKYNPEGYADFTPYAVESVTIEGMQGDHYHDFKKANAKINLEGPKPPGGYVWHHVQDGKTMQLVPRYIHDTPRGGFPHAGYVSLSKKK